MLKNIGRASILSKRGLLMFITCLAAVSLLAVFLSLMNTSRSRAESINIGLVLDSPSVDFNTWTFELYQGLLRAETELGITGNVYTSTTFEDIENSVLLCVQEGNDLCIGGGFWTADPISKTAMTYTETLFAVIDASYDEYTPNLRWIGFNEREAGYLAGSLAGLMTGSDKIGGVGGWPVPAVVDFLEGYQSGALCAKSTVTTVLTYTYSFTNPQLGAEAAQDLIVEGADVIFGVAGATGDGAILTATQSGKWAIGVDTDQYVSLFMNGDVEGAEYLLTSAVKKLAEVVYMTIEDVVNGRFTPGVVEYGLADGGIDLAPFHEAEAAISLEIKSWLEMVRHGIINGWIDVSGPCTPLVYTYLPFTVVTNGP